MIRFISAIAPVTLLTGAAQGIVVDGFVDVDYGAPLAVQTCQTGFGDNFSEWNSVYATVDSGRLYVMVTGNIEANFNKLEIFIDSKTGGENTMSPAPDYDFNGGSGWISSNLNGLTFDAGFACDYHMYMRAGFGNLEVDFIDRLGGAGSAVNGNFGSTPYAGAIGDFAAGTVDPGNLAQGASVANALASSIEFAMDNANAAGVGGACGDPANQKAAAAVGTGFEFSIDLADLAPDGSEIRLAIMQNNGDHNYLANQSLAGLPAGTCNLGGDGGGGFTGDLSGVDYNSFAGDQFITIPLGTPCPADIDGNGSVDFDDLVALLAAWGPCPSCPADIDGNGSVDFDDLVALLAAWGPC